VRRYTADSSPASILAVVEAEAGNTDAALEQLGVLLASPYAEPIHWLEAWILAVGGRSTRRGRHWPVSTARCRTTGCTCP
jgi:hypothetical protein